MRSLFIGNTDNAVKEIIKYFDRQVDKKFNDIYKKNKLDYKKLFYSKEYDNIFYFAENLDNGVDDISNFLQIINNSNNVKKYVYIVRSNKFNLDSKNEKIEIIKEIFEGYMKKKSKNIIFLNVSCLYGKDFIDGEINNIKNIKKVNKIGNYIHIEDFSNFLYLLGIYKTDMTYIELQSDKSINIRDLLAGKQLAEIEETEKKYPFEYKMNHSIVSDIQNGLNINNITTEKKKDKTIHPSIKILEIIIMYFISEMLLNIFSTTFNLQYIDFRLIFIIIVAMYYEKEYSLFATLLVILSFLFININSLHDLSIILSNTDNWVSIIIYITMTIIVTTKIKKYENHERIVNEKIDALEEQNKYKERNLRKYEIRIKELNKQLITHDNSISKVETFINSCKSVNKESIYNMFSENLEIENIVVFETNNDIFSNAYTNSNVDYTNLLNKNISDFITTNKIWVNNELNQNLPLYMIPIYNKEEISYIVTIWNYEFNMINNDYKNNLISLSNIVSFVKENE